MKPWQPTMTSRCEPERFEGQRVSAAYFRVLGVSPVLGRGFVDVRRSVQRTQCRHSQRQPMAERFGGDSTILGRQITLDDNLYTVIGVMPHSFENVLAPAAQLWAPLQYNPSLPADGREWGHHLQMIGRLRPGVAETRQPVNSDVILHTLGQMYAKGYDSSGGVPNGFIVNSLQSDITRDVKPGAAGRVWARSCWCS